VKRGGVSLLLCTGCTCRLCRYTYISNLETNTMQSAKPATEATVVIVNLKAQN